MYELLGGVFAFVPSRGDLPFFPTQLWSAGGEYVALGSYAITSVPGRPDLAPTAWRLEGLEPFSLNRQTLDEAVGQTTLELFRLEGAKPRKSCWVSEF